MITYRFLLGLVFACGVVSHACAQDRLILAHSGQFGPLYDDSARQFAEVVNDRLLGRVEIDIIGEEQLGHPLELLKMLPYGKGKADLTLTTRAIATFIPEFALFEMPFLIRDRDHMRRIEEEIVWPILDPIAQKHGYKIVGVWEYGFRHITNNSHPIKSPSDLKGLRFRTLGTKWHRATFQNFGASPVSMHPSEVYYAMVVGAIDGQESPLARIRKFRVYEVQKYLSLTGHVYTPLFLVMGLDRWNALDHSAQDAILNAAKETQSFVYETAASMDEEALKEMQASGIEVNEVDHEVFVGESKSVYDEFARSVHNGATMITKALQLAE